MSQVQEICLDFKRQLLQGRVFLRILQKVLKRSYRYPPLRLLEHTFFIVRFTNDLLLRSIVLICRNLIFIIHKTYVDFLDFYLWLYINKGVFVYYMGLLRLLFFWLFFRYHRPLSVLQIVIIILPVLILILNHTLFLTILRIFDLRIPVLILLLMHSVIIISWCFMHLLLFFKICLFVLRIVLFFRSRLRLMFVEAINDNQTQNKNAE